MPATQLTDFGENYGVPLFAPQAKTFHMSVEATSASISGSLFLQGAGGVIVVPAIQRIGRLPVLFWSQFLCALSVMAAALAPDYASFTAFRAIQGFVNTAPQVIGLSIVHDMFFFHQRARMVNVWVFCLMGGPFLGPFVASWLLLKLDWRADFGNSQYSHSDKECMLTRCPSGACWPPRLYSRFGCFVWQRNTL